MSFDATCNPMYFTGAFESPIVLVHLNPKLSKLLAKYPYSDFDDYCIKHRAFGFVHWDLDPSTLGGISECSLPSLNAQICWPEEVEYPPTSFEVLPSLNSWLDNWLDEGSFRGVGTIQFRGANGEVFDLRRRE